MNKDVIYVEPEDDITDIILKIEKAKERIVAIVPPKKAGVFRSIVNIKLMAKAATGAEKTIVLVTVDPSIIKLAAATKLPVAKNLQSAPVIPKLDEEDDPQTESTEELADDSNDSSSSDDDSRNSNSRDGSNKDKKDKDEVEDEEEEEEEEDEEPKKKKKKDDKPKSKNKFINWIKNHKKLSIFGAIFLVILIGVLIWMFVIAPAVTIKVDIQTTSEDFSKEVKFTTTASEEDVEEGIFYIEEKTEKSEETVKFSATGKKNNGNKASGELTVTASFTGAGSVSIASGTIFTNNSLSYTANSGTTLSWNGSNIDVCDNNPLEDGNCKISAKVAVTAVEGGSKYNISATKSGWYSVANVSDIKSESSIDGGTDDEKTVVQQSDVNNAKSELTTNKEDEYKLKLYESVGDDKVVIDSSFKQTTSDAVASPNVGEEVGSGVQPTVKVATTSTVYVVDRSKIKEFIENKADLEDGQKIYEMDDINIENFAQTNKSISGKLKTKFYYGPEVTEENVIEKTKGKGLGEAQQELKNIDGIVSVTIDKSYPWVTSIPGDTSKITIEFNVKNQGDDSSDKKSSNNSKDGSDEKSEE